MIWLIFILKLLHLFSHLIPWETSVSLITIEYPNNPKGTPNGSLRVEQGLPFKIRPPPMYRVFQRFQN